MPKTTLPMHSEMRPEDTWNAPSVFPSVAAWEDEYRQVHGQLATMERYRGRLGEGPAMLAEALDTNFQLSARVRKLMTYARVAARVDALDQQAAALVSKATTLQGQLEAATAFIQPEMLANGAETLLQWVKSDARLAVYAHYLDNLLRLQSHVRSAEVEELLGLVSDPFAAATTVANLLTNAEISFAPAVSSVGEEFPVTQSTFHTLQGSSDRQLRRSSWEHYQDGYLSIKKTLTSNLESRIKQNVFLSRVRGYRSALEGRLTVDHIPIEVYDNVVETFRRNVSIWHRYWALRRRVLGHDLQTYDLHFSLTADEPPALPYTQAVEWIAEGLQPLGSEYVQAMRRGCLEERWVDIYPNQGKNVGASSSGSPGTYPFIIMSYDNTLKGMSTLAHELGHSMHSYLAWQTQPFVYTDYTTFVAEVASNFHQAMVRSHLLRTYSSDRNIQIALLDEAMSNFYRYYFKMPLLARLERAMYERVERGEGLTADLVNGLFAEYLAEGYGSEVAVDAQRDGIIWATFPHLYMNFYVFQYTTGIAGAHALARSVLSGQPEAVERYLAFLRTGDARYPLDALQLAGVDLRTPEPIETAFAVLAEYIERLEQLLTPQ